ncbi:asparagine synthase-related protein [Gorillibacterium massiliense]|uniref:asparagine synthase-related protein n=1 Tax=Gorillibacterium massiliense TaxID=1280390 RepID=UPI0004B1FAD6|nr:asparagine synthase-related protein [Gorillibacterium massiliense]
MSAITGILNYRGEPVFAGDAGGMMQALQKYPCDAAETWTNGSVFLGCQANWVTAESVNQPIPFHDRLRKLTVTADVILDNRKDLFEKLQIETGRQSRITDCELILCAYRKWGRNAPRYLIGDYTFVIWDEERQQLFGARDMTGNRTLYYINDGKRFAFSTVANPLFHISGVRKELNEEKLAEFLAIPYILESFDVHSTFYMGIEQVPPAHSITVSNGIVILEQYDAFEEPVHKLRLKSNQEYEEAFSAVFQEAVNDKLRTRHQVGASLSGGLDSGSVVSFAAEPLKKQGKSLYTYSYVPSADFIDWTDSSMVANESPYIREVVDQVGNLTHTYLDFPERNALTEVDDILELMEGPYKFFENSFWIKGMLEQARRDGVGVLLNGGRGNYTLSWGPALDYYVRILKKLRLIHLYRELKQYSKIENIGRSRIVPYLLKEALPHRGHGTASISDTPLLIHPEFAARSGIMEKLLPYDISLTDSPNDDIDERKDYLQNLSASNHLGTSTTKLSLGYGILERDPTGDPRVIRFCLSLPYEQFVQSGMDRALARRITRDRLPDAVRLNQRKRGVQGADWMHRLHSVWPSIAGEVEELCKDSRAEEYLNVNQIRASLKKLGHAPRPDCAFDPDAGIVMKSLIVYRFLKRIS